jgi:D-alanine-D-alanine ligase
VAAAGVRVPGHAVVPVDGGLSDVDAWPVFVKPRYEGTAKGIAPSSRCDTSEAMEREVRRQLALYGQDLLVEAFVPGAEFTVAVLGTGADAHALPVLQRATEVETGIGLHALERYEDEARPFEYHVAPVLDAALEAELQRQAVAVHRALECQDFSRSDFRVTPQGAVYFLEVNPLPTFAPDGTFAIIAELMGRPYVEFLAEVLAAGLRRRGLA